MPLQTYRPQSPSVGSSFVKGWTTGENIKSQRFQNALGADRNAIAGQRTALAEKQNTRQQEKWEGEQGKIGRELAFGFANSLDYTSEENFLKSILGAIEPMGQKAVDALGDTTAAADIIMQMKAMRDLMLPGGRKDAPVKQEIKRAMNYMQHLKKTLGEKEEPDYKEGATRTYKKDREEITEEYKNGQWTEKAKSPIDKPEDVETPQEKKKKRLELRKLEEEIKKLERTPGSRISGEVYEKALERIERLGPDAGEEVGFFKGAITPGVGKGDPVLSETDQRLLDSSKVIADAYEKQNSTNYVDQFPSVKNRQPGKVWIGPPGGSSQELYMWDGQFLKKLGQTRQKDQQEAPPLAPSEAQAATISMSPPGAPGNAPAPQPQQQQQPMSMNERTAAAKEEFSAVLEAMDRGQLDMKAVNAKVLEIADKYKINPKTLASILQTPGPGMIERGARKIGRTVADTAFASPSRF